MEKAEISNYDLYDINDLCLYLESGWQYLANRGYRQCPHKLIHLGDRSLSALKRIRWAVIDVFNGNYGLGKNLNVPKHIPSDIEVLNLAASSNIKPYYPEKVKYPTSFLGSTWGHNSLGDWSKNKGKLQKVIEKVLDALATSSTYREAFLTIATNKKNLSRFTDFWSEQDVRWSKGEYLEANIEPRLREMAKWLQFGLRSKKACEEAWWNCLWLYMKPTVETMLEIQEKIRADTPIDGHQMSTLRYYLQYGRLNIGWLSEEDDKDKGIIRLILKPYHQLKGGCPFYVMSTVLLVAPAFDLAQRFQSTFPQSRFLQKCHAPSCGKYFYTHRRNQVACGGSRGHKKTQCALEWKLFRYWLNAQGKNPQKEWANPKQIESFRSRDH